MRITVIACLIITHAITTYGAKYNAKQCQSLFETNTLSQNTDRGFLLTAPRTHVEEKAELKEHFWLAFKNAETFVRKTHLKFPEGDLEILVHPFFNYEGPIASILRRRDKLKITVPYRWLKQVGLKNQNNELIWTEYSQTPMRTLPLFYHEIGHAVFRTNIEKQDSSIGEHLKADAALDLITRESDQLMTTYEKSKDKELKKQLEIQLVDYYKKFDALDVQVNSDSKKNKIFLAMEELFADVTAVLITGNNSAMVDATTVVDGDGKKISKTKSHYRDFSDGKNALDQWVPTWEAHDLLAPTRHYLFRHYLSDSKYLNSSESGLFYQKLLLALSKASDDTRLDNPKILPGEANSIIMEHLDHLY